MHSNFPRMDPQPLLSRELLNNRMLAEGKALSQDTSTGIKHGEELYMMISIFLMSCLPGMLVPPIPDVTHSGLLHRSSGLSKFSKTLHAHGRSPHHSSHLHTLFLHSIYLYWHFSCFGMCLFFVFRLDCKLLKARM